MLAPVVIDQAGSAWSLTSNDNSLQIGGLGAAPVNVIIDGYRFQGRSNGAAWPLEFQNLGGYMRIGSDAVASGLDLRGPTPTGTQLRWSAGGQIIGAMFPYGAALPADLVIQTQGGSTVSGNLALQCANGQVTVDAIGHAVARFGQSTSERLRIIAGVASPTWNYISFYDETGVTRRAYFGVYNDAHAIVTSDSGGHIYNCSNSGYILFGQGQASSLTEWGRFDSSGNFMLGMNQALAANAGMHYNATTKTVVSTTDDPNNFSLICNKTVLGSGHNYVAFRNNNTTIGSITRNAATAAVLYNTSSDYRLKQDCGRITNARERIKVLQPRRFIWNEDPTRQVQDGFFAHEVTPAVPEAVTGEKDADEMQMIDTSRLVPLLVAAVQELTAEVEQLRAEVALLKGAA